MVSERMLKLLKKQLKVRMKKCFGKISTGEVKPENKTGSS
jgi:hypothetical protein